MALEKELTPIERELVLQYLRDDNVPLTVTLEDKPEKTETELEGDKLTSENESKRVPASAIFPVAIPAQQLTVLDKGIILLKNSSETASSSRAVQPFLGKTVRVQFYFRHVGLYFITEMKEYSHGLALVVPKSILRVEDEALKNEYETRAELSFTSKDGSSVSLTCLPLEGYRPFAQPRWNEIPLENQQEAKSLLEKYVLEARTSTENDLGNGLHLLSVTHFLTQNKEALQSSLEGRAEPLYLIFVDEKRIVLACYEDAALTKNSLYHLTLECKMPQNKVIRRVIKASCLVTSIYSLPEKNAYCYVCSFEDLKEEDFRYLSEKVIRYR